MASMTTSAFIAAALALGLAGCNATVVAPGGGPGYGGPGYGGGSSEGFGRQGFNDGINGQPWMCDSQPRRCGAGTPDPRQALTYYRDGWRQGWTQRCERARDQPTLRSCEQVLGGDWGVRHGGGWERGRGRR